jgi:hypothetical protein
VHRCPLVRADPFGEPQRPAVLGGRLPVRPQRERLGRGDGRLLKGLLRSGRRLRVIGQPGVIERR